MGYIGAGPTRFNTADGLTVTGDAEIGDDLLLNSDSAVLSVGADGDLKITHDGTNGDFESAGNLTFDVAGDINLDADGGDVNFKDGGVSIGYLSNSSGTLLLGVNTSDADFKVQGNDGGSTINALTLDMSAAGFATFNAGASFAGNAGIGTASPARQLTIENTIANSGGEVGILSSDSSTSGTFGTLHFGNNTDTSLASIRAKADGSTTAGKLEFNTEPNGGAIETRMTIDSSGNVGIGTNSPTATFRTSIKGDYSSIIGGIEFDSGGGDKFTVGHTSATSPSGTINVVGAGNLIMKTNNAERARFNSSGSLFIGCDETPSSSVVGSAFINSGADFDLHLSTNTTGGNSLIHFINPNGTVGSIFTSNLTTSYSTSSDYRLKENVTYDWNATSRLKQLKPARFNFIANADTTVDGFLAHEVQDIVPEAINGTKDAMRDEQYEVSAEEKDADGNVTKEAVMGTRSVPDYQGIDQAKLVPLLCKTILELEARITALEAAE